MSSYSSSRAVRTGLMLVVFAGAVIGACSGPKSRSAGVQAGETTRTSTGIVVGIEPEEEGIDYNFSPARVDTVVVRQEPTGTGPARVELLIKGYFADGCSALHSVSQERTGSGIAVALAQRRPRNMMCTAVIRPYRFYLTLDGAFASGDYTVTVNELSRSFVVR